MPFKGNDFQPSRGEAYAAITSDYYGQEHDEKLDSLVDLENGTRKYWADQLRALAKVTSDLVEAQAIWRAAVLLDPYSSEDLDGSFAQTTLTDAPEGAKWITPDEK
jgi:hypothetical protein